MEELQYVNLRNRKKLMNRIWFFLFGAGILVALFTLVFNNSSRLVDNLFLLPFSYCICLLLSRKVFIKQPGLALLIIETVMICRFLIIPIMFALTDNYHGVMVNSELNTAVWYMVYEEITVGFVMGCWASIKHKDFLREISGMGEKKFVRPLTVLIIAFWCFIIITNSKLRGNLFNFSLLTQSEMGFTQYTSLSEYRADIPGVFKVFFYIGLVVLLTTLVHFIARRKWYKPIKVFALTVVCAGFISSMWSSGFNVSRWGMLIATIISVYVLIYSFPNRKKQILVIGAIGVCAVVLGGSLLKSISHGYTNYTLMDSTKRYLTAEYFDEYFQGIAPVANGIETAKRYSTARGPEGILIDCFYNFPYAMKVFGLSGSPVATDFFHQTTGHYDLIMPTVTESIMQFGGLCAPLYSCLLVWLALWFDRKQQASTTLYRKLFYTVLVFWTSLFMAVSTNVIEANIWYAVIGIWLISFEEKMKITIGRKTREIKQKTF